MNSIDFMYLVLLIVGLSSGCLWVVSANGFSAEAVQAKIEKNAKHLFSAKR